MRWSITAGSRVAGAAAACMLLPQPVDGQSQPAPASPPPDAPAPAPPLPPLGLGTVAFLDAEGGPGTLFQWNSSAFAADRVNGSNGDPIPVSFRTDSQALLLHVAHTTKTKFLGAFVGVEVLVPIVHVRVRSVGMRADRTGLGDVIVGGYLQWSGRKLLGRPFSARLDLDAITPTGSYDRDQLVNPGSRAWSLSPYLALTWQLADRWEISNRTNFNWTAVNRAPPRATVLRDWQAGQQLAVNLSASYEISRTWRLGLGGYTLQQVSDSRSNGDRIASARQKVWALGPGVRWSRGRKMLIVNAYKEFAAENRPQGYEGVLRFFTIF